MFLQKLISFYSTEDLYSFFLSFLYGSVQYYVILFPPQIWFILQTWLCQKQKNVWPNYSVTFSDRDDKSDVIQKQCWFCSSVALETMVPITKHRCWRLSTYLRWYCTHTHKNKQTSKCSTCLSSETYVSAYGICTCRHHCSWSKLSCWKKTKQCEVMD